MKKKRNKKMNDIKKKIIKWAKVINKINIRK